MNYKMIPTMYFDQDGNKAKALTEGGFYYFARMAVNSVADEITQIWNDDQREQGQSLKETIQNRFDFYQNENIRKKEILV